MYYPMKMRCGNEGQGNKRLSETSGIKIGLRNGHSYCGSWAMISNLWIVFTQKGCLIRRVLLDDSL